MGSLSMARQLNPLGLLLANTPPDRGFKCPQLDVFSIQ